MDLHQIPTLKELKQETNADNYLVFCGFSGLSTEQFCESNFPKNKVRVILITRDRLLKTRYPHIDRICSFAVSRLTYKAEVFAILEIVKMLNKMHPKSAENICLNFLSGSNISGKQSWRVFYQLVYELNEENF